MVEYHGWITLSYSFDEDEDDANAAAVADVRDRVSQIAGGNREVGVKYMNGTAFLWCSGCTNHFSAIADEVVGLYQYIACRAPASYGLLHVWDEEDVAHGNAFQVWRLAKGKIQHAVDSLLSPCVPVIEDLVQ